MIRAILKNGVLEPLDPPPAEWMDGRELRVDEAEPTSEELDEWARRMDEAAASIDPGDYARIEAALQEQDVIAKAQVRREMGLD